jgi:type IV conjugative transfer system protein traL
VQTVPVPRTLDAPARFLFWDSDYVLVAMGGFVVGLLVSGLGAGMIGAVLFVWAWKRARAGGPVSRAVALAYWHMPLDFFRRVPQSARRHFIG